MYIRAGESSRRLGLLCGGPPSPVTRRGDRTSPGQGCRRRAERPIGVSPGASLESPGVTRGEVPVPGAPPQNLISGLSRDPNPALRDRKDHSCSHLRSRLGKARCCPRGHMTQGGKTHAPTSQGDPRALWNWGRHICPGENLYPMPGAQVGKGSREAPGKTPRLPALAPGGAWAGRDTGRSLCLQHTSAAWSSGFRFA